MTNVLVVDDVAVDRELVARVLGKDVSLELDDAVDGAEGLEKIRKSPPDLVVTDLVMPKMDGLKLVTAVKREFPLVPVILITSQGNEEVAIQALQEGAASYVPKHGLDTNLLDSVNAVLALSQRKRGHYELMGFLAENECSFKLENDPSLVNPLATYLRDEVAQMGICGESESTQIGVAVEEAVKNALFHGNLEVGYELRAEDQSAYDALVAKRRNESPYQERRIHVDVKLSSDEARFTVRDEGQGFDVAVLPGDSTPGERGRLHGRGVLLMRTFMHEVTYNESGNSVTLVKRNQA